MCHAARGGCTQRYTEPAGPRRRFSLARASEQRLCRSRQPQNWRERSTGMWRGSGREGSRVAGKNAPGTGEGRGGEKGRFRGAPDHLKKKKKRCQVPRETI